MIQTDIEQFENQWKIFETKLKLQLYRRSRDGIASGARMNVILKDCVLDWSSGETTCGRWLMRLQEEEPEKARIVAQILMEDMCFREPVGKKGIPGTLKALVPVAGALAGLVFSRYTGANATVQMISTATPAAMLVPAVQIADSRLFRNQTDAEIRNCLKQLELYRDSVIGILQQ